MLRVISCLVLSLLALSTYGQNYYITPSRDSLQAQVYEQLDRSSTGTVKLPAAVVQHALNRALVDICTMYPALEKVDTLIAYMADEGVAVPTNFDRLRYAERLVGLSKRIPLRPVDPDTLPLALNVSLWRMTKTDSSQPSYIYEHGRRLVMRPKPVRDTVQADTILIYYYATDTPFSSGSSTTAIETKYLTALVDVATYYALRRLKSYEEAGIYLPKEATNAP